MKSLYDIISNNTDWLVDRVLSYAKTHGYTEFSSTLEEPWRASICGFSEPMLVILTNSEDPLVLDSAADYVHEPLAQFAVVEARLHRERGIKLSTFLGLAKYYRQSYLDLLDECVPHSEDRENKHQFIERFFDYVEIAFCAEWVNVSDAGHLEEINARNRLLTNEKNKYLTILESLNDPVILLDETGTIENLNLAAATVFTEDAHPGIGYYDQRSYPLLDGRLSELLACHGAPDKFEATLETVSGPRNFEIKTQHLLDISEKFAGTVVILSDITEYLRTQREADAANRAKSVFLATMSHEIRTPINGIVGIGHLLKNSSLNARQSEYVAALVSSGESLVTMVNEVLDYSRIEADAIDLDMGTFDVRQTVSRTIELVRYQAQEKGLKLSCDISSEVPAFVVGDLAKVQRILLNLVANAVKYTQKGSVSVQVSTVDDGLRYRVIDTGPGIPSTAHSVLFEPFVQLPSAIVEQVSGTGLGLAICKRLASAMGGKIGFDSAVGKGSTFWFEVPLVASDAITADATNGGADILVTEDALQPMNVLLVEDNAVNSLVAEGLLVRDGHLVRVVETGEDAIAAVQVERFDIVLMDLRLDGMQGLEAIHRIRTLDSKAAASVPILVVTADIATTEEAECFDAGADAVLEKPFTTNDLKQAMARSRSSAEERSLSRTKINDSSTVIDLSILRGRHTDLGAVQTRRIIETFLKYSADTLDALLESSTRGDTPRIAHLAHGLKSAAGNLGLAKLHHAAAEAEAAARKPQAAMPTAAIKAVRDAHGDSIEALSSSDVTDMLGI